MIVSIYSLPETYSVKHSQVCSTQCGLVFTQHWLQRWDGYHNPGDTSSPALSLGQMANAEREKETKRTVDADGDVMMSDDPF